MPSHPERQVNGMIFTIEEARDILRLDGSDNDAIIMPLLSAIPPYLEATTGYCPAGDTFSPVAKTAGEFLLQLWYYGENADTALLDCYVGPYEHYTEYTTAI